MQSTTPEETDPHDIFVIEPDVVLAARVDQPLAEKPAREIPSQENLSQENPSQNLASPAPKQARPVEDIMGDILSRPSTPKLRVVPDISIATPVPPVKPVPPSRPMPPVSTNFRATAATADAIASDIRSPGEIGIPDDILLTGAQRSRGAWAKRAAFAFLFALASVAAAEAWDRYGDTARQMLADWTPALTQPSSQPAATTAASPQPAAPAAEAAIPDQTPAPPSPAALQPAPGTAAATPAAAPDQTQQLQSMTQDLAAMGQ